MENQKWRPIGGGGLNPSARLRAARSMPPWMQTRNSGIPPPPLPVEDPPIDPDYEVIEFGQTYSNTPIQQEIKQRIDGKRCDLCGSSAPSVRCTQCSQNFCPSCDDMYHRHPKRQTHLRKDIDGKQTIVRPPLPPKGEAAPAPVPPPRRNKRMTRTPVPNPIDQRDQSGKVGMPGTMKRIVGGRPLPAPPFSSNGLMSHQPEMPPQMGGFHGNVFPEWEMKHQLHQQHRVGSFANLNGPGFNPMVQAHSMTQLNCPSCHHGNMWDPWQPNPMVGGPQMAVPWGGMPQTGTWHSSAILNRRSSQEQFRRGSLRRPVRDSSSASDEDDRMGSQGRRRNPSPALSRRSRNPRSEYDSEDEEERGVERGWGRSPLSSRTLSRRVSMAEGINRSHRQDEDTLSVQGGRRFSHTMNRRDYLGNSFNDRTQYHQDFDRNQPVRGNDFETMSNHSNRRYEREESINRERRRTLTESPKHPTYVDDPSSSRASQRGTSDFDDISNHSRMSEHINSLSREEARKNKSKKSERFSDTGRRRSSPVHYRINDQALNIKNDTSKVSATKETIDQNGISGDEGGEELGPVPDSPWECIHCTFINEAGTRVCAICCKTTNKPKPNKSDQDKIIEGINKIKVTSSPPVQPVPVVQATSTSPLMKKKGPQNIDSHRNLTSTGTSPPPQSISTQTYEETGHKLKRATSLADYDWRAPQRSYSRQSLLSDTQSLPVTPPKSRSPESFNQLDAALSSIEQPLPRKNSEPYAIPQRNRRAGSQPPEYISTLVQKQVKQGLEMVKLLREAEEQQFSADDLAVALVHCEDGDPVAWLQQNWKNMIDTVVTLATNYGHERKENTVGTISASEARDALRMHDGNVWAAVTECVEQRQKKYAELLSRGNFSREDIVTVLTANHGNLEAAYMDLNKSQLKPFLMRIWGPPQGTDNDSGDFTKLAHDIEWEGQGGKQREEVSFDLPNESNNDRIQTWLENYVHKPKKSQSMLQLNTLSSKNSDSSDFPLGVQKYHTNKLTNRNRRYSDVHRYLTHCFTANNSLQISPNHMSMQDVSKSEEIDPLREFLIKNIGKESIIFNTNLSITNSPFDRAASERSSIAQQVQPELDKLTTAASEQGGPSSNISPEPFSDQIESTKSDDVSIDFEHSLLQNDNDLNDDEEQANDVLEESSKSEIVTSEKRISLSSSESYESLESSDDESISHEDNSTTLKDNQITLIASDIKNDEKSERGSNEIINHINKTDDTKNDDHQCYDVLVNGKLISNKAKTNLKKENDQKDPNLNKELIQTENDNLQQNLRTIPNEIDTNELQQNQIILEPVQIIPSNTETIESVKHQRIDNQERQNVNTQETVEEKPAVLENTLETDNEELNANWKGHTNDTQSPNLKNDSNTSEDEAEFNSAESDNNPQNLIEKVAIKETPEEVSGEIQEVSHTSSKLSPLTAFLLSDSKSSVVYTSEGNSDIDISPIPTDSERDLNSVSDSNLLVSNNGKEPPKEINRSSHDLVNLLKESLAKEDVVERIVSTLFQTVLRASIDLQSFPISNTVSNKRHSTMRSNNRTISEPEESSDCTFYEAEENQDKHSFDPNGLSVEKFDVNEYIETDKSMKTFDIYPLEGSSEENNFSLHNSVDTNDSSIKMFNDAFLEVSTEDNSSLQSENSDLKDILPENLEEIEDLGNFEREVRRILAEGMVTSYSQAELAVKLLELNFEEEHCIAAANECTTIESAIAFLQQECYLCAGKYTMKQMIPMLECEHICCQECANNYFTLQITERTINDCVCPFCKEPELNKIEEDKALHYFSNLDILLKTLVRDNVHELFQRKLRDRTLMQDPNFSWCIKCSSGFIANPRQKRHICPDCKAITCASCKKLWEKEHEKMTCEEFTAWQEYNDPDNQLERHLTENGVTCPKCKTRYVLAKGGCMHLTCPHCKHEFCSGCGKPFLMGNNCKVSPLCEKLGLHSHHPRNCLFYLRDKEPKELQRLLEENGIDYKRNVENLTDRCKIQLLKETPDGLVEAICGYAVEGAGLCRTHFIERLVDMIRINKIDPVGVMDETDAQQELRRHGKDLPTRADYKSDHEYLAVCIKIIKEHIPLD